MLIISRKENEEILIDHDIRIKILSISENQVKLGITAPDSMTIYRTELYNKIKEMNINASSAKVEVSINDMKINKLDPDA